MISDPTVWDPNQVREWMLHAGKMALLAQESLERNLKDDFSVVTQADHDIENWFASFLNQPQKQSYLLGEETLVNQSESYIQEALNHTAWVVDPIDGTAPYANGLHTWGVSLGQMVQSHLVQGSIFLPAIGELYLSEGQGVVVEQYSLDKQGWNLLKKRRLEPVSSSSLEPWKMLSFSQQLARQGGHKLDFYWQVTGSSVYALTQLLRGRYGSHITKFRLWDFAGALPLLHRLGFVTRFAQGHSLGSLMDSQVIELEPNNPQRWTTKGQVIFCTCQEDWDYLKNHINWPEE